MTTQVMAQRVLLAKQQGDLRFEEFVNKLSERTGVPQMEVILRIQMMAMGVA